MGCKITALEPGKFLAFQWKSPDMFEPPMNTTVPLTHVVVFFVPCGEISTPCTELHVVHSGWGNSPEWEEARQWFAKSWERVLENLVKQINGY